MKKRNVIKHKNLSTRSPIGLALLFYLLLDKWNASEWVWGAVGLLFLFMLIAFIIDRINEVEIDIFDGFKEVENKKSNFRQKLEDAIKKEAKIRK